jgi:hypothetical protein
MFCGSCGTQLHELAVICPKCGTPTKNYQATNAAGQRRGAAVPGGRFTAASAPDTSGLAIASLIMGLVGVLVGITAIPAVICGHLARGQIRNADGALAGSGMALTGLILGYVTIACCTVLLLAAIAIPSFFNARDTSRKNSCINNLRQIDGAQQQAMLALSVETPTVAQVQQYLQPEGLACPSTDAPYDLSHGPPVCPSGVARHVLP